MRYHPEYRPHAREMRATVAKFVPEMNESEQGEWYQESWNLLAHIRKFARLTLDSQAITTTVNERAHLIAICSVIDDVSGINMRNDDLYHAVQFLTNEGVIDLLIFLVLDTETIEEVDAHLAAVLL